MMFKKIKITGIVAVLATVLGTTIALQSNGQRNKTVATVDQPELTKLYRMVEKMPIAFI